MIRGMLALLRTVRDPQVRGLVTLAGVIIASGTVFYSLTEDWSLVDSFYFSVMTLLTVGYGDLVPTTSLTKIFTVFFVLSGAGVIVAFITAVAKQATAARLRPERRRSSPPS